MVKSRLYICSCAFVRKISIKSTQVNGFSTIPISLEKNYLCFVSLRNGIILIFYLSCSLCFYCAVGVIAGGFLTRAFSLCKKKKNRPHCEKKTHLTHDHDDHSFVHIITFSSVYIGVYGRTDIIHFSFLIYYYIQVKRFHNRTIFFCFKWLFFSF